MPSLKDLKNRIESVKSTRKITKAMQMVAAAKLRRAQEAAEAARPYAERMDRVLGRLAMGANADTAPRLLTGTEGDQVHLLIVATAERGLCGGFNSSIVRLARQKIAELEAEGKEIKILTIGSKGRDQLKREHSKKFVGHVDLSGLKRVDYATAQSVAMDAIKRFETGEFDTATIFYNRFRSVISQVPTEKQLIPASFEHVEEDADSGGVKTPYEYEPEEEAILADLLPRAIATQIFAALLENAASEQGARMSAMDNATRNAGEMIDKLTLEYNRSRQAAITKELIEIISGAEAL
ncbi:MAG: F0F1 ATP synthase subunit gamma [Pseudomonadota bacterium]